MRESMEPSVLTARRNPFNSYLLWPILTSKGSFNGPLNGATRALKHQLGRRGIEVAFTSRDSIGRRITHKKHTPTNSGVYVLPCKKDSCDKIYVGQSHNIPKRLDDHSAAKHRPSMGYYTSALHSKVGRGHELMPADSLIPIFNRYIG